MIRDFNEEQYGSLLHTFRPRVIRTKEENERALAHVEKLMEKETRTPEEEALYELLIHLIHEFEEQEYPIENASPLSVLHHLMEARGIRQKDLEGIIKSKGVVSEMVNGKRSISKRQAKALGDFFGVSPALFI